MKETIGSERKERDGGSSQSSGQLERREGGGGRGSKQG